MRTSNYLIISFLYLGSHYLFSVRSQQDKGRKVRQVKSVMRHCSHFHPLCISVKGQVRFMYRNVTPLLGNAISKHHYRFYFVKVNQFYVHSTTTHLGSINYIYFILWFSSFTKRKNSLQINARINHPDSAFTLVSKDVGGEAFVLLRHFPKVIINVSMLGMLSEFYPRLVVLNGTDRRHICHD